MKSYQGIHNYYYDFLKSFKRFISDVYPNINNFQFNYSDTTYLNYALYDKNVLEFPICHINIENIQTEDNHHVIRGRKLNALNHAEGNLLQHICNNNTLEESILLDFRITILSSFQIF